MKTLFAFAFLLCAASFASAQSGSITVTPDPKNANKFTFSYSAPENFTPDPAHTSWLIEDRSATQRCLEKGHALELCRLILVADGGLSISYTFKHAGRYFVHVAATDTTGGKTLQKSVTSALTINEPFKFEAAIDPGEKF
jgi:hypothetical protein